MTRLVAVVARLITHGLALVSWSLRSARKEGTAMSKSKFAKRYTPEPTDGGAGAFGSFPVEAFERVWLHQLVDQSLGEEGRT